MQFMPTNDVFHHITRLMQIHKDKELILDIFKAQGIDATKSLIKAWQTKTGDPKPGYREMPRDALGKFIDELYQRKLIECDENDE